MVIDIVVIRLYNKLYKRITGEHFMGKIMKNLGEAELEIMQVIWHAENPVTSNYILKELQGLRKWQLSTLMTSLSRLSDKGFVACDRETGMNLYTFIISENEYKAKEGKHFLEKLYNSSIQNMVATLYSSKVIKTSDMDELRKFLDEMEDGQ